MRHPSSRHTARLYGAFLLLSSLVFAQQPVPPGQGSVKEVSSTEGRSGRPKLSAQEKLAFQTLEVSQSTARGFDPPMRTYELLQIGPVFVTRDPAKARAIFRDAFTASLEIKDDENTQTSMQQEILSNLLPLSQADVEELLPQAANKVRRPISDLIIDNYAQNKQFDKALEWINQILAVDEFPYGSAGRLMDAMPSEMTAEKQALFMQAVASYKSHEHPWVLVGGSTLTGLINKFGTSMPPALVLQAIDEILTQAKAKADQDVRLAGSGGSARFANDYQYQLFALMPILRKLDESLAKQLLENDQDLQAKVQQFPDGLTSIMPPPPAPGSKSGNASTSTSTGRSGSLPPMGYAQDFVRRDARSKVEAITQQAETDPLQAIAQSAALPLQIKDGQQLISPRAQALENIARAGFKNTPVAADAALSELRKVIVDLPPRYQVPFLSHAADLYLQMGNKDAAEKSINEGLKVAEKLLAEDSNPESPNQAFKAWWPSTDAYRRFVEVETKISDRATLNILKEIKDPEVRVTESIMFARSLLGLPMKRTTIAEKRGDNNSTMTLNAN